MFYYGVDVADMTVRQVNRLFRQHDDSHKWPICGRFNATERAIRRLRRLCAQGHVLSEGDEYAAALDNELSAVVNAEV